jgi:hypothetical protein
MNSNNTHHHNHLTIPTNNIILPSIHRHFIYYLLALILITSSSILTTIYYDYNGIITNNKQISINNNKPIQSIESLISSINSNNNKNTLFHITSPSLIEGALFINRYQTTHTLFDFNDSSLWKTDSWHCSSNLQVKSLAHFIGGHCYLIPEQQFENEINMNDHTTTNPNHHILGNLTVHYWTSDDNHRLHTIAENIVLNRFYSDKKHLGNFRPLSQTILLKCKFTMDYLTNIVNNNKPGTRFKFIIQENKSPTVNTISKPNQRSVITNIIPPNTITITTTTTDDKSIICGRPIFGNTIQPENIYFWCLFYLFQWGFHHIVVYEVGLDRMIFNHPIFTSLRASGQLIVIDLRDELQRLYGVHWLDMILVSTSTGQLLAKAHCVQYVKSLSSKIKWTLHVDFDEFLFKSFVNTNKNKPENLQQQQQQNTRKIFHDYISTNYPNKQWLSFGKITSLKSTPCLLADKLVSSTTLYSDEHYKFLGEIFDEFQSLAQEEFNAESSINDNPYVHKKDRGELRQHGKRKNAIQITEMFNTFGIMVHDIFPCSWGKSHVKNEIGLDLDPRNSLLLREYPCVNVNGGDNNNNMGVVF